MDPALLFILHNVKLSGIWPNLAHGRHCEIDLEHLSESGKPQLTCLQSLQCIAHSAVWSNCAANMVFNSRISAYEGRPVHISAYILDTNHGQQCEVKRNKSNLLC